MSYKIASAIRRGGWLIHSGYVQSNMDQILNMFKGSEVDFGLTEKQQEEMNGVLYAAGISLASNTQYYQVGMYSRFDEVAPGSIAIVNLLGPVLKYGDICSYGMVDKADLLQRIAMSGKFKSVILNVDSPGGQADGTQLLADTIIHIRETFGLKFIAMVNDGMMASAAMWIGSACDEIWATKATDMFGSIGVMMTIVDFRKALEAAGIDVRQIYADRSTDKNGDWRAALEGDESGLKEMLNFLCEAFITAIQTNRGARLNTADEDPFTGKMYPAEQALKIGLIDGIASSHDIIARASELGDIDPSNPLNSNNMFGNKFSALSALAGIAAASITADQVNAVNAQIEAQKIEGVSLALDSELETAATAATANSAALGSINTALGEGNHKATLSEAVAALVKVNADQVKVNADQATVNTNLTTERDNALALAAKFGAKADDTPTGGKKEGDDEIEATSTTEGGTYSQADEDLKSLRAQSGYKAKKK